jgi:hypothetical protein
MFEGLRRRWRFRNLEDRIANVEAEISDGRARIGHHERFERSFGGHQRSILDAERQVERAEKKLHDLRVAQIERDSF